MSKNYYEFESGTTTIYVEETTNSGKQDSTKHLIIVDNGKAHILLSHQDLLRLVELSARRDDEARI